MINKTIFSFALAVSLTFQVFAQDKYTLSGYVKDVSNGEVLIGATIYIKELNSGTTTNVYGFYSLTLPSDSYTVDFRFVGFETVTKKVNLTSNKRMDIEIGEGDLKLQEVVISAEAEDENVTSVKTGVNKVTVQTITDMPALLGEPDIIKSIQTLPGISTVGEGASGFNVRGGNVGQNLILLDEAPVYNSSHLFGFFSVFNPDAVKDVELYKGGIPARYGGRISSLLDVRMKEGNSKQFAGEGGVGLIFSRLSLEGPIVKDKASFIVAARRSYIDILARPFTEVFDNGAGLNFYDITLKTNVKLNENNTLYLSGYSGRDVFKFDANQGFSWGNQTSTLRWNHLFSNKLFSNFSLIFSDYDYELEFGENENDKFTWSSNVRTYNFKPKFSLFLNDKNNLHFGGEAIYYEFVPAKAVSVSEGQRNDISLPKKYALENSVYLENEQKATSKLTLNYGLRWSKYGYYGKGNRLTLESNEVQVNRRKEVLKTESFERGDLIQTYNNFEPRFNATQLLSDNSSLKFSFTKMAQYLHLVSNTTASIPLDVWTPSTNNIKPQIGYQYSLGYYKNFRGNTIETSVETYYKDLRNQVDYIDGADLLINEELEADLLAGKGRAYGVEFYVKKNEGRLNGWVSYTLGKTELKTEGLSNNGWYPTRFDQRHNLKLVSFYELKPNIQLSLNFTATSGTPTTFPDARYSQQGYVVPHNSSEIRNNFRIPWYHRLDVGAKFDLKDWTLFGRRYKHHLTVGIYNLYNRRNPFSIYFVQNNDISSLFTEQPVTEAHRVSILGTSVPSLSYNFKF